jgi:hypothetical protein
VSRCFIATKVFAVEFNVTGIGAAGTGGGEAMKGMKM